MRIHRSASSRSENRTAMRPAGYALAAVAVLCSVALSGCASDTGIEPSGDSSQPQAEQATDPAPIANEDGSQGEATLVVGGREFNIDLTLCSVYADGDILLSGPAQEVGGATTGYFDGDVTSLDSLVHGEFRVDLGADGKFQSTDDFLAIGDTIGGQLSMSEAAGTHTITAQTWNAQGDELGEGSLVFRCA